MNINSFKRSCYLASIGMGVAISYSNIGFGASQTVPSFTQLTTSPIDLLGFSRQLLDAAELADINNSIPTSESLDVVPFASPTPTSTKFPAPANSDIRTQGTKTFIYVRSSPKQPPLRRIEMSLETPKSATNDLDLEQFVNPIPITPKFPPFASSDIRTQQTVVNQRSVGKRAKSFHVQESEAKPALCAAVVTKRLCCHIQLK